MPKFTPQQLDELYHQKLAEFAASPEKWRNFLDTAARLYKYDFKSQVLIWSQRPDATACAELPLWNDRLHRRVNRGSNGIGIVDNSSNQPRIKYLFDISDTSPRDPVCRTAVYLADAERCIRYSSGRYLCRIGREYADRF